jgi:hypothetical protein
MSQIPTPFQIDVGSLGKSIKDFVDYWRNFKGKKIRITCFGSSLIKDEDIGVVNHTFKEIIEGIVDGVQAYPPGFILTDVHQFVRHEWTSPTYVIGKKEPLLWHYNANDSDKHEKFDRKFISFNYVSSIEFLD